ncbi:hypothetical protein GCM10010346_59810 [Streptomyces chryseus]|uniref:Uncharacterized protein n=1 Tax=Streptomyces chryseus TaxID=68186 RepID=A0ABQ3EAG1_9ACTN|nr:hypothetical protein GCM10010346_59810 [Streptomyces chryseus]
MPARARPYPERPIIVLPPGTFPTGHTGRTHHTGHTGHTGGQGTHSQQGTRKNYRGRIAASFPHTTSLYVDVNSGVHVVSVR